MYTTIYRNTECPDPVLCCLNRPQNTLPFTKLFPTDGRLSGHQHPSIPPQIQVGSPEIQVCSSQIQVGSPEITGL